MRLDSDALRREGIPHARRPCNDHEAPFPRSFLPGARSAFSAQARWERECFQVEGESKQWVRTADSGQQTTYHFCPECGSTVYYGGGNFPELVAIPLGALDDPYFATIDYSVWEKRKHGWIDILGESVEHSD